MAKLGEINYCVNEKKEFTIGSSEKRRPVSLYRLVIILIAFFLCNIIMNCLF